MVNNRFTFFTKAPTNQYTTVLSLKFPVMLTGKTGKLHILLTRESSNSLRGISLATSENPESKFAATSERIILTNLNGNDN